jgi:hypothetical protein
LLLDNIAVSPTRQGIGLGGRLLDDYAARVSEGAVWALEEGALMAAIIVLLARRGTEVRRLPAGGGSHERTRL